MATADEKDAIDEFTDITQCSICLKVFTDPRILPCIHTFCLKCLQKVAESASSGTMPCPICRQSFAIPGNSCDGLSKNFFMTKFIQATKKLNLNGKKTPAYLNHSNNSSQICDSEEANGEGEKEEEDEEDEDFSGYSQSEINCSVHSAKLDVYCHNCSCLICLSCLIGNHQGHRGETVAKVASGFRREIESDLDKLSSLKFLSQNLTKHSEKQKRETIKEFESKRIEIYQKSKELKDLIDQHTRSLLEDLSTVEREKLKEASTAESEAEQYEMMLSGLDVYCEGVLRKGSPTDICRLKGELHRRVMELEEMLQRTEISSVNLTLKVTPVEEISTNRNNLLGNIEVDSKKLDLFKKSVMIVGYDDDQSIVPKKLLKMDLSDQIEVTALDQTIPSLIKPEVAMATNCNMLFVAGVGDKSDEIWKFHLISGWSKCGSLVQGRIRHCTAFVRDVLYLCGGYDECGATVLDSIEAFDSITCRCETVGWSSCAVQNACCIAHDQSLYVFCGLTDSNVTMERVQIYDTMTNTCALLVKRIPNPYNPTKAWRALALENFVVLFSRWTCFLFDIESKTWKEMRNLRTDVDYFGLVHNSEKIFVIGGGIDEVDGDGKWMWMRRGDIRCISYSVGKGVTFSSRWKDVARLPDPALVHACAVMEFPKE